MIVIGFLVRHAILFSPPQIVYLWAFVSIFTTIDQTSMGISAFTTINFHLQASQIHHHRFSYMSLDQFSPPQIIHLWAFQIHYHRFSSMGLDQFSPPQIKHLRAFQIHCHRLYIYGHFRFTTIDQTSMGILDPPPQIYIYGP